MSYIKKKSMLQEKKTAKEFNGKLQIASGALWGAKGDVRTGERNLGFNENDYLIENKYTDKDFYRLTRKTWEKIEKEAINDNLRIPLIQIDIQDESIIVMDYNYFLELYEGYNYLLETKNTSAKSYIISKEDLKRLNSGYLFCINFRGVLGKYKPLNLVIMRKEDFLNI